MSIKRQFESFDFVLISLVACLALAGVFIVGSATHINQGGGRALYNGHIVWLATGFVIMLLSAFIDYHFILRFYIPIYILNIALLAIVLVIDNEVRGVSRWLGIGDFGIQPAEFSKLFTIIFLAKFIDKKKEKINNISVFLLLILFILLPAGLIYMQPSLSASIVVVVIGASMVYGGGISYKKIIIILLAVIPVLLFLFFDMQSEDPLIADKIFRGYQFDRFLLAGDPNVDPEKYRQTRNSIHAIASGMLTGKGLYNGPVSQAGYIYASYNDFIMSVVGEEFGFVGCMGVIGVMFLIVMKCIYIAGRASDLSGKLIATGVAAMLFFQTFVNVGVATDLLPNTGMPFPFLSYGGSSMWINMISVGLVLNVAMSKPKSIFEG